MRSSLGGRIRSRLKSWKNSSATYASSQATLFGKGSVKRLQEQNPVDKYYRQRIKANLPVFSRFALQTRSLVIRDIFARVASYGEQDLGSLLAVLESQGPEEADKRDLALLISNYDTEVLLALADLLANSARNDLDTHSALQIYDFVYTSRGATVFLDHHKLQYVEALGEAGRYQKMEALCAEFSIGELAPL